MITTAGIDVGSTYTKAVILSEDNQVVGRGLLKTGFKLNEAGDRALQQALEQAHLDLGDLDEGLYAIRLIAAAKTDVHGTERHEHRHDARDDREDMQRPGERERQTEEGERPQEQRHKRRG